MCSLGIEPTTFALLTQCSNHWATVTHRHHINMFSCETCWHNTTRQSTCCLSVTRFPLDSTVQEGMHICRLYILILVAKIIIRKKSKQKYIYILLFILSYILSYIYIYVCVCVCVCVCVRAFLTILNRYLKCYRAFKLYTIAAGPIMLLAESRPNRK